MENWHTTMRPVDLDPPPLGAILSYKSVYALCTVTKENRLRATHLATCLVHGPEPIWGVWTIGGVFQRFFGRKAAVEAAYPKLVWRRKQSTWNMVDVHDKDEDTRRGDLERIYHEGKAVTGHEVEQALTMRPTDAPDNVVRLRRA